MQPRNEAVQRWGRFAIPLHDIVFVGSANSDVRVSLRVAATGAISTMVSELQNLNDPLNPLDIPPTSSTSSSSIWTVTAAHLGGLAGVVDTMILYITNQTASATPVTVYLSALQNGVALPAYNAGNALPLNSGGEAMLGTLQKGEHDFSNVALKV